MTSDPDLTIVFATPDAAGMLEGRRGPGRLIGCIADGVIGGTTEAEDGPAVAVWQAAFGDVAWTLSRVGAVRSGTAMSITGWRHPDEPIGTILLADPASFPTQPFIDGLGRQQIPVIGGLATSSSGTRLMVDGDVQSTGAIAITFGEGVALSTAVSQGCRPIGKPGVVTKAKGHHLIEISGRTAFTYLSETFQALDEHDQALAQRGLQLGIVRNEYQDRFDLGDFLIRPVMNLDRDLGYITCGSATEVGQTVQFHVRDPESAASELTAMLARVQAMSGAGALLFTCNGRGRSFFGRPNHDAETVDSIRHPAALAGFFAAGEIGPVGGDNHLHGYTASLVELSAAG